MSGYTVTVHDSAALYVVALHVDGLLGYVAASDEWVDGTGTPLPEHIQQAAERLRSAGLLPEFEVTR
ncbi:hypothetical protein CFN78_06880 [Amycolatopsis antarctica]|uniref:Uncharacterized protein n=1 Tax=Amycolatopsis antarctica TaxID=1854586 RepID=A0A263D9F6_9PSEU|nr:hypothetical protein [Amycolatopsis antarctica]OZM74005.1 hypothetical protein CFN78_06880 [Amycolatopsis antarctica]